MVSIIETLYVWLQLFNGSSYYYSLGELILKSLGMVSFSANDLGQGLILSPLVMSGYLPIFIMLLIIITNSLIAIYTYKLGRVRGLGLGIITAVAITSIINASLISLITNPWLPQIISTALAIMMYYYVDNDNKVVSASLSALIAFLSPVTDLLNVLIPITRWFMNREFNESSQYVLTIGLIAFTYYWIAGTYSIIHEITTQEILNQVIYLLSTTSFMQLATLDTAIPALLTTVLGGLGFMAVVPAILVITLIEIFNKLRENKLAALTLAVALIITALTTPISPLWPPYQGTSSISINWEPISKDYANIYSLASLAPIGYIENTVLPIYSSIVMNPGRQSMGYITPIKPVNGTYAICGDYQLDLKNYTELPIINDFEESIGQLITNATSYVEDPSLIIPGGLYQSAILVSTGELTIPPGRYVVSTTINVIPVTPYMNASIPQVMSIPLTNTVLPISANSIITFNLNLNFTGSINKVIIYGVSYSEQPATLSLTMLRNGQVIARVSGEAPPITQGMKPYPISFIINVNITRGTYELSISTDQPLILYVSIGTGMKIISNNSTLNYPSEAPTYSIEYITTKAVPMKFTWLRISLATANQSVVMNITSGGTYVLRDAVAITQWINSSINLLITVNEPVLPTNITISPISIKPLEPTHCPTPLIIKALEEPSKSLIISMAALPIAAALPLMPGLRLRQRMRKALLILGVTLMLLFYVVWALGFTNLAPQLYSPGVLRIFGILFIIGLVVVLVMSFMVKPKDL
ncbi:MAG: hypothetical protein ACP5L5_11030 [Vulcanisaeta sp.]|uniref:hypothetical protein n=1 Tax=Vulcanisaeta sp. TaxID=2020871 RepID=UPI003D0AF1FE